MIQAAVSVIEMIFNWKVVRQLILLKLVVTQTLLLLALGYRIRKAETCNVVFVRYLREARGINVSLDRIYEDGKKWVSDPRYASDAPHHQH